MGFRQGPDDLFLGIQKDTDELTGRTTSGTPVTGTALVGSVITLGQGSPPVPAYELTITKVEKAPYWVDCPTCSGLSTAWKYSFKAINLSDRCEVRLCRPGLDEDPPGGLVGSAVIFRGDYYDDTTHDRHSNCSEPPQSPPDLVSVGNAA